MSDDGSTKDDVKIPDGEVGDKINKMFTEDGKDTSKLDQEQQFWAMLTCYQMSLSLLLWVRRPALTPRRLPNKLALDTSTVSRGQVAEF